MNRYFRNSVFVFLYFRGCLPACILARALTHRYTHTHTILLVFPFNFGVKCSAHSFPISQFFYNFSAAISVRPTDCFSFRFCLALALRQFRLSFVFVLVCFDLFSFRRIRMFGVFLFFFVFCFHSFSLVQVKCVWGYWCLFYRLSCDDKWDFFSVWPPENNCIRIN